MTTGSTALARDIRARALRLDERASDYDTLLEMVGDRSLVLLGEASHGTREFYRMRCEITRRLIEEKGFDGVAVEADWPAAYRLNRYVKGAEDKDPFGEFRRFPQWMWRNREVAEFIEWLRAHNARRLPGHRAGFYGLDLYSLYDSMDSVIRYLEQVDPEQSAEARRIFDCLDHVRDPQQYGYQSAFKLRPSCRADILRQLKELRRKSPQYLATDGLESGDEQFSAEQNAQLALNAENYYREMFGSRVNTWNLRDRHMTTVLFDLQRYLRQRGGSGKLAVWAHNSHLGDARATEMGWNGEQNIGQLTRMRAGYDDTLLVGFTTYTGFVAAAREWNGPVEHRWVRPGLSDSYEQLFANTGLERFFLPLKGAEGHPLRNTVMLERAIGVIYRPETERASHYFRAGIKPQFDAVFHLDETSSVEPLDTAPSWQRREAPETYPFGI